MHLRTLTSPQPVHTKQFKPAEHPHPPWHGEAGLQNSWHAPGDSFPRSHRAVADALGASTDAAAIASTQRLRFCMMLLLEMELISRVPWLISLMSPQWMMTT